ncbi:MAG: hypothetical protein SynsKO_44530 [Synoicihabitans sp.]
MGLVTLTRIVSGQGMGRFLHLAIAFLLAAPLGWADDLAADIGRIHIEAIGGQARVERLHSFRAAGQSRVGDFTMDFQMWAKRPSSIRVEVMMQNQTIIQGWDGEGTPWLQGGPNGAPQAMPADLAKRFMTESAFDTPLFNPEERGFALEYAGEDQVGDRPVVKLLATRNVTDQSTLYLAADTYFIVQQDRVRYSPGGGRVLVQTQYGDFRPVLGVIMPHRIVVKEGDQVVSDVMLSWMEPNPPLDDSEFRMPDRAAE